MPIKLATWNINSVRAHIGAVERFLGEIRPDILCLQETKVADEAFPLARFRRLGYRHHLVYGQKGYHGVAIFSAGPRIEAARRKTWCGIDEARHVYCRIGDGIELHNFYVPAGGDLPDPKLNPKFRHKLEFMDEVTAWFCRRKRKANRFILVGDLNVAPLETDVWSHRQLLKVVSHTPVEVARMQRWYESHDWVDAVRLHVPPEQRLYSWWSYRARDWLASDKGRRLDHIWVTPALRNAVAAASVYKPARGYEDASDHAPVLAELDI